MKEGILIIGAGGVSRVATVKCAMNIDTFEKITLASRTLSKCEMIQKEIKEAQKVDIDVAQVDADDVPALIELIKKVNPKQIAGKAYGETKLINNCISGVSCNENQHKVNRRVGFRLAKRKSAIIKEKLQKVKN